MADRKIVESYFVSATHVSMTGSVSDNDEDAAKEEAERIASELQGEATQCDFEDMKKYDFKDLKEEQFLTAFEVETIFGIKAVVLCTTR